MKKSFVIFFFLAFLACTVANGQQIHILLVADTADPSIGENCKATVQNIQGALNYLIPQDRYSLHVRESGKKRYNKDSVLADIRRIKVAPNDTFVFLYDGHGARAQGHHYLHMPNSGKLWSADVQKAVKRKGCRLGVILTGSCNVPTVRGQMRAAAVAEPWDVRRNGISPVMEELLINHRGLMHMNGAWPGQFGFTSKITGNWLFDEFFTYCTLCPTGRPTWRCMDRMMDRQLGERFQRVFNGKYVEPGTGYTQTNLKTISWSLPKSTGHSTSRFGVLGDDSFTRTGVTARRVAGDSPANGTLRRGDVIVSINGMTVKNTQDFFDLVRCSPRTMHFEYKRGSRKYSGQAKLRW